MMVCMYNFLGLIQERTGQQSWPSSCSLRIHYWLYLLFEYYLCQQSCLLSYTRKYRCSWLFFDLGTSRNNDLSGQNSFSDRVLSTMISLLSTTQPKVWFWVLKTLIQSSWEETEILISFDDCITSEPQCRSHAVLFWFVGGFTLMIL